MAGFDFKCEILHGYPIPKIWGYQKQDSIKNGIGVSGVNGCII